ncbi:uncharacterized protein BX664DRAFT_32429 [Halteromyces radiatus]|uniref:uncharacterized protein n=1 Tax=Halteromyces radiatus TaxID=101107 RepID=UPI00221FF634|nr:uncharacterized protein BX664DRAFT_32429 [Halteromyces radiatus]KAI8100040.1 hypothetical protein BX664DRAFT_32429 [Halteromyces radiatus]
MNHSKQHQSASFSESVQKEIAFLHEEHTTWRLLDTIQRSTNPLQKCSGIKEWISKTPDTTIISDMLLQDTVENEIDEEIQAMIGFSVQQHTSISTSSTRNNHSTNRRPGFHFDDDDDDSDDDINMNMDDVLPDIPQLRRQKQQSDHKNQNIDIEFEKINKTLYTLLRKGDLDKVIEFLSTNDEPWRTMLFKSYVQRCKKIQEGKSIEWDTDEQQSWRLSCKGLLKKHGLGPYGKAVYALLLGDVTDVLPVCKTWEDVIWAYYNALMEHLLGAASDTSVMEDDSTVLSKKYENIANQKDPILPRGHPKLFFHLVQVHLLNQDLSLVFELVRHKYTSRQNSSPALLR